MRARVLAVVILVIGCCFGGSVGTVQAAETSVYAPEESEFVVPVPAGERPVCPNPPEPAAEGAEAAVVEQRLARIEADESCRVGADRLEAVAERLWWVVSEQLRQHAQGVNLLEAVGPLDHDLSAEGATTEAIRGPLVGELQVLDRDLGPEGTIAQRLAASTGSTEEVVEGTEESSEGLKASIDAGAEATRSAIWYLIGLAAGAMVGYFFYRQVMPRA